MAALNAQLATSLSSGSMAASAVPVAVGQGSQLPIPPPPREPPPPDVMPIPSHLQDSTQQPPTPEVKVSGCPSGVQLQPAAASAPSPQTTCPPVW
eukprot:14663495-Alexandrium_andersonii.AAC.1